MMDFFVRPAITKDVKALYEFVCELNADCSPETVKKSLWRIIEDETQEIFAAVGGNSLLGILHLRIVNNIFEDDFVEIAAFAVGESYRRMGSGTLLLKTAECWCSQSFYKRIRFVYGNRYPELRDFLLRYGYEENSLGELNKSII